MNKYTKYGLMIFCLIIFLYFFRKITNSRVNDAKNQAAKVVTKTDKVIVTSAGRPGAKFSKSENLK